MTALIIICALVALVTIKHWIGPVFAVLTIIGCAIAAAAALIFCGICFFLAPFELALRWIYRQTVGRIQKALRQRRLRQVERIFTDRG